MKYKNQLDNYSGLQRLLHSGSYIDVKNWFERENVELDDDTFNTMALDAIIAATDSKLNLDSEKALKILNTKLKEYMKNNKEKQ